jgi:hypothetical protein
MKMSRVGLGLLTVLMGLSVEGCVPGLSGSTKAQTATVTQTLDEGSYLFLHVESGAQGFWLAAQPFEVSVGDRVRYQDVMEMRDFYSPTLNRTFPKVYFVTSVSVLQQKPDR